MKTKIINFFNVPVIRMLVVLYAFTLVLCIFAGFPSLKTFLWIIPLGVMFAIAVTLISNRFSGEEVSIGVIGSAKDIVDKAQLFFFHNHPSEWSSKDVLAFSLWLSHRNIINPTQTDFEEWKRESSFEFGKKFKGSTFEEVASQLYKSGSNCLIIGSVGSGKTRFLMDIANEALKDKKDVFILTMANKTPEGLWNARIEKNFTKGIFELNEESKISLTNQITVLWENNNTTVSDRKINATKIEKYLQLALEEKKIILIDEMYYFHHNALPNIIKALSTDNQSRIFLTSELEFNYYRSATEEQKAQLSLLFDQKLIIDNNFGISILPLNNTLNETSKS